MGTSCEYRLPNLGHLLESKNLQGVVSVKDGVPHLARRHDQDQVEVFDRIKPFALASAWRLNQEIQRRTGHHPWVQAVVVFWSEFPEGLVEDDKCVFIHGSRLREWMQERPERLGNGDVEVIGECTENIKKQGLGEAVGAVSAGLSPA